MPLELEPVQRRLPDHTIHWFASTGSTMTEAARLAAAGCASGTVVGADEQTAGIGRQGHLWHSEPGNGLYVSIVLRQQFPVDAFPGLTLAIGLAVREAVLEASGIQCDLRWPNDLLVDGRKCAGILLRMEAPALIAGIGINVNHAAFPEDLASRATSLRLAGGRTIAREDLLVQVLEAVDRYCRLILEEGIQPVLRLFTQASSYVSGRRVIVDEGGSILNGTTAGLDAAGFLLLRRDNGKLVKILAGGVRPE
ncbi:MAG: biotin--[acetyl-CoA-carboxylase] ligase [Acidobacteriia bacterium]|nr:biotin--[acetyl-CoA-carboxylase] ligase [Terriglobia bacterium]